MKRGHENGPGQGETIDVTDRGGMGDRLMSLDVLRGLTVMGMILVNSAAAMFYDARAIVYSTLLHSHWNGLTLADIVFPAFLLMMGVSIPMALARAKAGAGLDGATARRIAGRTFRLFAIGFVLSNLGWLADAGAHPWRLWGVLQRIGLVYGACAVLFLTLGPRARLVAVAAILVLYWPLVLVPSPDGVPTDLWTRGHNLAAWVDRAMLEAGAHIYVTGPAGYDPEGLLGTLPAVAHGLIGVALGERLARRGPGLAQILALAGAVALGAGLAWGVAFPIVKDIWSSSFVLVTCGITLLLLAGCHALFDGGRTGKAGWFVAVTSAFGSNAIGAYLLHELTAGTVGWSAMLAPYRATQGVLPPAMASLLPILLYMALIGWAMLWLRRNSWVIRV